MSLWGRAWHRDSETPQRLKAEAVSVLSLGKEAEGAGLLVQGSSRSKPSFLQKLNQVTLFSKSA